MGPEKKKEIQNPRRILAVSLADSARHLSDVIKGACLPPTHLSLSLSLSHASSLSHCTFIPTQHAADKHILIPPSPTTPQTPHSPNPLLNRPT